MRPVYTVSKSTLEVLLVRDAASLCSFLTYLGMCLIAKAVLIFAIYNTSKPCIVPFVSDIGSKYGTNIHLFAHVGGSKRGGDNVLHV